DISGCNENIPLYLTFVNILAQVAAPIRLALIFTIRDISGCNENILLYLTFVNILAQVAAPIRLALIFTIRDISGCNEKALHSSMVIEAKVYRADRLPEDY
ncbi:MAG: hypothetical protein ACI9LM_003133, partial [Alteromonadaceae bacterium]